MHLITNLSFQLLFDNKFEFWEMSNLKKETVVLFPYSSGMGHLIPMVELAKQFITHNFSVIILIVDPPYSSPINSSFVSRVSSAHPSISFHRLPKLTVPDLSTFPQIANLQVIRNSNPLISTFLTSLSKTSSVRALILDMFCTSALDVASDHDLQAYIFFASGASVLSAFFVLPGMQCSQTTVSFKDLGETPLHFPGVPPIPASHLPPHLQDRESDMCKARLYDIERWPKADGILVNTFESLERRAVETLKDGSFYPDCCSVPPVYCVGPVVAGHGDDGARSERHECLTWLDAQPKGSVVFLCFGSAGTFSVEQLGEIASGLEKSGQRFLWVVRYPTTDPDPSAKKPLEALLPVGFLARTKGRGMVVDSWAPQVEVLGHESVGGFLSHCGWNSTLEAVSSGMPMIAWPLYAEQKMNKVFLVEEVKLAVEMKGYDKELVSAEEVETKVRWLMEAEEGRELRERAAAVKKSAIAAKKEGGSSEKAWKELVIALGKKGN